jgi:hypothetical protein
MKLLRIQIKNESQNADAFSQLTVGREFSHSSPVAQVVSRRNPRARFASSRLLCVLLLVSNVLVGLLISSSRIYADPPRSLSPAEADTAIERGDRFAGQREYLKAVELYNSAYMGIVSSLRGQAFQTDVEPSLMTRDELGQEMKKQIESEYTADELALMDATFHVFHLAKPDVQVGQLITNLLTEEVGGFYDPKTKAMVLVRENDQAEEPGFLGKLFGGKPTFDAESQKTVLSHELTHTLQDQLYNLLPMQESISDDDDMSLAFQALVEGDATLLMFAETARQEGDVERITKMNPEAARFMFSFIQLMLPFAGGETFRTAPPIFRDSLVFPYFQGMIFNLHLSSKGGFGRIDSAYQSPPISTEQILHPSKYTDDVDLPTQIEFESPTSLLPKPWTHIGGNCFGEFQISVMLGGNADAKRAAAGWDGDRYEIFTQAAPEIADSSDAPVPAAAVWCTTWDSPEDAAEFEEAAHQYFDRGDALATVTKLGADVYVVLGVKATLAETTLTLATKNDRSEKSFPVKPSRWDERAENQSESSDE